MSTNFTDMKTFLCLQNVVPRLYESPFTEPLNWEIKKDEVWSVMGKNGSGKTLFSQVICGQYNLIEGELHYPFFEKIKSDYLESGETDKMPHLKEFIKLVSFNSVYSIADFKEMYYQQRFNSMETEWSPSVEEFFTGYNLNPSGKYHDIFEILNIDKLLTRRLIQLSSGELRKLLIAKVLLEKPRMIIFDNPFIGLDASSCKQLDEAFYQLSKSDIQLIFLVPSPNDLPSATSHMLELADGKVMAAKECCFFKPELEKRLLNKTDISIDWSRFPQHAPTAYKIAVKMENIEIFYGKQVIAKGINWEIKKGEKWALLGPNGSGKSTLLSYIFADNPQAYSKKLTLFDRERGTGESIWDIKKRIGFTSSEMHLYYRENVSCLKVVESGFFDSIGLYRQCSAEQTQIAEYLLEVLKITHLKNRSFLNISSGEQRLVLFARSLVKNPELLILDEPFHGLDDENKNRCLQVVKLYCKQPDKSLIFVTHHQEEIPDSVDRYLKL